MSESDETIILSRVGFVTSPDESTLERSAVCIQLTQRRSLLSELLAMSALEGGEDEEDTETDYEEGDDEGDDEAPEDQAPVRQESSACSAAVYSEPVAIPCCAERSEDCAKDAYRRLVYARQMEQLHYQQQQQQLYQRQQQQLALQQRQRQHMLLLQQQQQHQLRQGMQQPNLGGQSRQFGGQAHATGRAVPGY